MKSNHLIQLIILASIWGSSFLFTRIAVGEFGPIPLTFMRSCIASFTLLPILLISGQWPTFKKHWRHILVVGLISTALPFSFMNITTLYTSAGFSSIMNALTPIFSAIIAWLWLKEYLSIPAIIGIGLSFLGVLVMIMDKQSISTEYSLIPIFTGLCAAALYGLTGNYSRSFLTGVSPVAVSAGCQFFAALMLLPVAFYTWPEQTISLSSWGSAAVLGVLCTGIGYIMFFRLLDEAGVTKTMVVTYLVPVFAMTWGTLFLDEIITIQMLAGAAFILSGITLTTGILKKRQKPLYEN
jgi:drug/metabolite transporter (DMT)-like permease